MVKNQIYKSEFVPTWFEKKFGKPFPFQTHLVKAIGEESIEDMALTTVTLNGLYLTGRMDRVDLFFGEDKTYAVAFDYKTGNNEVEHKDLYFGNKVQLLLYLAVLQNSGFTPVAALYSSLSDATEPNKYLFGPKWNNEFLMKKFDATLSKEGKSTYTDLSYDKKNKVYTGTKSMAMSQELLQSQIDYAIALSEQAITEINEGFIHPTPHSDGWKSSCDYCKIKAVCRHVGQNARTMSTTSAQFIHSVVSEEKQDGND